MKKTGKKSKLMVGLVVGVAMMICGFIVYAAANPSSRVANLNFMDWKSDKINNDLDATDWDELMDTLAAMKSRIVALEAESDIPSGAIMAFDKDMNPSKPGKNGCPDGWSLFSAASGKFLMGVDKSNVGIAGGNASVKLSATDLPNHQHFLRYGLYFEYAAKDNNFRNAGPVVVDWSTAVVPKFSAPRYNYELINESEYSNSKFDILTSPYGSYEGGTRLKKWGDWTDSGEGDVDHQSSINILNPYVGVILCKKD